MKKLLVLIPFLLAGCGGKDPVPTPPIPPGNFEIQYKNVVILGSGFDPALVSAKKASAETAVKLTPVK